MKKTLLLIVGLMLIACAAFAQFVMPDFHPFEGTEVEVAGKLFTWYTALFYVAGFVVTRFSSRIPWLKKIDNMGWRAAIVGGILIAIFIALGAKALPVVSAFLLLVNPYEMFIKPYLGATKSVADVAQAKATKSLAKKANQ